MAPTFHLSCLPPEGVLLRSSSDSPEAAPPARPTMGEPKRWPSLARMRVFSSILKKEGGRRIVNEVTGTRATSKLNYLNKENKIVTGINIQQEYNLFYLMFAELQFR